MAFSLSAFQAEIVGVITTAWPEVALGINLKTSVQATKQQIVEQIKDGRFTIPGAVVYFGDTTPEMDYGLGNDLMRLPVSVFYIGEYGNGFGQTDVDAKLRTLRAAIDDPTAERTTFQSIERGSIDTAEGSAINAELLAGSKTSIIGGNVSWSPGLLIEG